MLLQIILPLKAFAADFTAEGQFGAFVGSFMDHEIVWLGEPPLTIFAHKLALGSHFSPELIARNVVIYLHYSEHFDQVLFGELA